ncbi:MAG TPA: hypothetical protein VNG53_09805 [Bacteroidia bacterium]|nr:hypothetical protein [Bacteroidia bacterium]
MNVTNVPQLFSIFWLSTVKFATGGAPVAVFIRLPFFEAVSVTTMGGFASVLFFTFLSDSIWLGWKKLMNRYEFLIPRKPRKIHSFRNKMLVKFKRNFGLIGVVAITPVFLSIPIGTFIAVRYYSNKQQIVAYMFASVLIWAIILYFFYSFFYNHVHFHFFHLLNKIL